MRFEEAVAHANRALAASKWSGSEFALIDIEALKTLTMTGPIYCHQCKHWDRDDKVFCDFDGKQWHGCKMLYCFTSASGEPPMTPEYFYCGDGEKMK